jgi:rhomboid protease GluP
MSSQPIITPGAPYGIMAAPRRYWPVATFIILGLNIVIFMIMTLAGGSTNPGILLAFGASYAPYFRNGEYWRAVMPMFLHIGVLHLAVNSYALFILGPLLERVYGYGRYSLIYVGAGIGSSLLSMKLSQSIAAGASGAIFGIAGAMLAAGYLHRDALPPRWGRAFGRGILPFIVLNLALGYSVKGIDNWGHVGGLMTGMILAGLIPPPKHHMDSSGLAEEKPSQALVVIPLTVVILAMGATANQYRLAREVSRLIVEGDRLRSQRQPDRAMDVFKEAARKAPKDERPPLMLGALLLDQKRPDEAIQQFNNALRLNPDIPQAKLGLSAAYRLKGDFASAQKFLEAALGGAPATAEGHTELADLCAQQKLYAQALEHYKEALRLKPDLAVAHNNLAWMLVTTDEAAYRNPKDALFHARRAVELSQWKEAAFVDTLAEALFANQEFSEAVKVQEKALQLDPDNSELQEHMARYRKAAGV